MIIILSPAKSLDFKHPGPAGLSTTPEFIKEAAAIADRMRKFSAADLAALMKISGKLAYENYDRYQLWRPAESVPAGKQAILAYKGDAYQGLAAGELGRDELMWAQGHLRILSGLYGILRPLDLIMPYRLEFATKLKPLRYKDLYSYWNESINRSLLDLKTAEGSRILVNLASAEYYKAIDSRSTGFDVITPVFKEYRNGDYRFFSMFGKRARGLMTRFIIEKRIEDPEQIKLFDTEGYSFNALLSGDREWVFTR